MKNLASTVFAALLLAPTAMSGPAQAVPVPSLEGPPAIVTPAAGDCYAVGQQVAAQNGGTLASASAINQDGRTVCQIVVLVPARDGQRPRRVEVSVPL